MPIYEYVCTNNDCKKETFEITCSISKRDYMFKCPLCGTESNKRSLHTGGVVYRDEEFRSITKRPSQQQNTKNQRADV